MSGVAVASAVAATVVTSVLSDHGGGGNAAAAAADPFASQRGEYQKQLLAMMTPTYEMSGGGDGMFGIPSEMKPVSSFSPGDPSYQWRLDQGAKTVNANAAASGMLNSGNRLMELQTYGQNQASTEYANQFARLSQLAGVNVGSPASAGQIIANNNVAQSAGASAIGNAVGSAVKGWGNSPKTPETPTPETPITSTTRRSDASNDTGFSFSDAWKS